MEKRHGEKEEDAISVRSQRESRIIEQYFEHKNVWSSSDKQKNQIFFYAGSYFTFYFSLYHTSEFTRRTNRLDH